MGVLLIIGIVGAVAVLGAADWLLKVRTRLRRRRSMSERLAVATTRMERQHERHQEAEQASEALTSYMPAIERPAHAAVGLHGVGQHGRPARKTGRDGAVSRRRDGRRRTGPHAADGAARDGEHARRDGAGLAQQPRS